MALTIWGIHAGGGKYAAIAALTNIPATLAAMYFYEFILSDSSRGACLAVFPIPTRSLFAFRFFAYSAALRAQASSAARHGHPPPRLLSARTSVPRAPASLSPRIS